jgi:hypothetical protein
VGLLLLASLAPAVAASPYSEGQVIEITGAVTDADGNVQPGKTVVLQVYRHAFSLSGRNKKGLVDRSTVTDASGRYALQWPWHDYYNRFELSVGDFGPEGFAVLEKVDLSRRILRGSPVITSFILGDAPTARHLGGGEAGGSAVDPAVGEPAGVTSAVSSAQRSLRDRQGEPDLVDTLDLPYGRETTWWYFDTGKAYRFLDGELRDELAFDPVRSN